MPRARIEDGIQMALPFPPSVNRIWRSRKGDDGKPTFYKDRKYKAWIKAADGHFMVLKRGLSHVGGPFDIVITLSDERRIGDADNRCKPILDYLQRVELIDDDKMAESVTVRWGYAPEGCRIEVTPAVEWEAS